MGKKLNQLCVVDLWSELDKRNLDKSGLKAALVEHLEQSLLDETVKLSDSTNVQDEVSETDVKSKSNKNQTCSCELMAADLEGVKLDIVILQQQMKASASYNLNTIKDLNSEVEITRLQQELAGEKKASEKLKTNIESLEDRATKAEEERDSLRLALTIIMQDKTTKVSENIDDQSQNPWRNAESKYPIKQDESKKHDGRSAKQSDGNKRNGQRATTSNQYEILQVEDLCNEESPEVSSTKPKVQRPRVNVEKKGEPDTAPCDVAILGDSMIKHVDAWKLRQSTNKIIVRTFSGAKTADMKHYIKPTLSLNPKHIIIHTGTNDLKTKTPADIVRDMASLGKLAKQHNSKIDVSLSEVIVRNDKSNLNNKSREVNKLMSAIFASKKTGD
ncbi:Werner syndrome ATP-dependent helicase-like [Paramuricea clavata]|uniref:Werner syndrome ATP-dependent helicase-like n=1 Tax=Paramuricea clavata TaxID=317549 RepID=A0A7D9EVC5_PARCT|nr:Werner syndrome ATP-dependent helicase-like [Paramuricea clavata]